MLFATGLLLVCRYTKILAGANAFLSYVRSKPHSSVIPQQDCGVAGPSSISIIATAPDTAAI